MVGDLAFVTYGHHALIAGKRVKAIFSIFLTILLALIFTGLQAFEYHESSFSMSDSVFGSTFFASTGLHGLTIVAPTKNIKKYSNFKASCFLSKTTLTTYAIKEKNFCYNQSNLLENEDHIIDKLKLKSNNKCIYLDIKFLQ